MFDSWNRIISSEMYKPILSILNKEYRQYEVYPAKDKVFDAFRQCPYDNLRVVIIGQDPYPQKGYATGIAFANPKDVLHLSPSLQIIKNKIIKEFNICEDEFDPTLLSWEKQGILLLNSALTVRAGMPGSHTKYWHPFIKNLIIKLNQYNPSLIYVFLGNTAKGFAKYVSPNCHILSYPHPSYFCRLGCEFNTTMFKDINDIIFKLNKDQFIF